MQDLLHNLKGACPPSGLKVLHIVSGDLWAGAEAMARNLFEGLLGCGGIEPSAVVLNDGRLAEELKGLGARVAIADESKRSFPGLLSEIRTIVGKTRPHVIHSHRYKEHVIAAVLAGTRNRPFLVGTQHGLPEVYGGANIRRRLTKAVNFLVLSRRFDRVVAVSEDIRSFFEEGYGLAEDKVRVIHNGVRVPETVQRPDKAGFSIGSSGRLFPVKDFPLMVEIAGLVARSAPVRFELAGEGPEREGIESRARGLGIEGSFVLKGHVDDMSAFYKGLDIYISTSVHEGIPMSVLEALSHGLPVVAPRVGGLPEIIDDGVEGFLIEGRRPEEFAKKCLLLMKDKALRVKMSEAARARASREFSIEAMAGKYRDLYVELCASAPR